MLRYSSRRSRRGRSSEVGDAYQTGVSKGSRQAGVGETAVGSRRRRDRGRPAGVGIGALTAGRRGGLV